MDKAIYLSAAIFFALLITLVFLIANINVCIPVSGVDHNSNNDPFTANIGWCG